MRHVRVLFAGPGARRALIAGHGGTVELVLRRYIHERGVPVYGYKARALPQESAS